MKKMLATENSGEADDASSTYLIVSDESKETVYLEIPDMETRYEWSQRRRHIHRVPPQLQRKNKKRSHYDPTIVSLGPYHHGRPELLAAEEVKYRFLDRLASGNDTKKNLLYRKVMEKIDEIRGRYADHNCIDKYDDRELGLMMVLDACFIIALMDGLAGERDIFLDWHQCLGVATLMFAFADIMVLENQIPYQIIKLILGLLRGKIAGEELLRKFEYWLLVGESKPKEDCIPRADQDPILQSIPQIDEDPLHLLEAFHRMLVVDENCTASTALKRQRPTISGFKFTMQDGYVMDNTAFSVMDLKAKGIEFTPSSSYSVRDIKFKSGAFRAELQLPVRLVFSNVLIGLSNLIAYEMSPGADSEYEVVSYTNFMKSLIASPEDVKELQEKGILVNKFQNHEQLVEELKDVDTFGLDNTDIFKDVKLEIEKHCRSKSKTWLADLIHTRFASPWTVTALLAATFLLCLTFLQTYFTINPVS